jgi:hypothetical protein
MLVGVDEHAVRRCILRAATTVTASIAARCLLYDVHRRPT